MNRLSKERQAQVLHLLVEGNSIRSICRLTGVSKDTVSKLLVAAGKACKKHHDRHVRGIPGRRNIQCDELWGFIYAKDKVKMHATPLDKAGSVWTWTALDSRSKLMTAYHVSMNRDARSATKILRDLKSRLERVPNIYADKLEAYRIAAKRVFGSRARLRQSKGDGVTSHVERHNLSIRMGNRRYARRTNAFSKKLERHVAMLHLWALYYNFCWIHSSLRVSPAMEAGVDDKLRDVEWIVDLIEANTPKPKKPGPKPGTKYRPRKKKA